MKTFINKIFIFVLLTVSSFLVLKLIIPQKKTYFSVFVNKLELLKDNRLKRKIVLIGGSNVGWGLSAQLIEESTGIKTINLGHHAGFGLIDFQSFISKNINKDDIIVFSPEWEFYGDPFYFDSATLDELVRYNYDYGKLTENYHYMLESFFLSKIRLNNPLPADKSDPYRYDCINANGDVISHCGLQPQGPLYYVLKQRSLKIDVFPQIFPFLVSNKTIFLFPPTQQKVYNDNKQYLEEIETSLLRHHYTVADRVTDNVYPDSLFFDQQYHITCETRTRRTAKFINYLNQILQ